MLTAAMAALARWNGGQPHTISTLEVRHALTAALRVQKIGDVKGLVELRKAVSSRCCNPVPGLIESRRAIADALEAGKR